MTRKEPTEPHQGTISPMGYLKIPERVGALVGVGAGVQVEIQADPATGAITVRRATPKPPQGAP